MVSPKSYQYEEFAIFDTVIRQPLKVFFPDWPEDLLGHILSKVLFSLSLRGMSAILYLCGPKMSKKIILELICL